MILKERIDGLQSVKNKIEEVENKVKFMFDSKEKFYQQQREKLENAEVISKRKLKTSELIWLRQEYKYNFDNLDVGKLDQFLKRLKFFAPLDSKFRVSFYKRSQYFKYEKGEYVFRQGEKGNLMYLILKGEH